ncbi:hypothetical protein SADUNF_Sadunf06G0024400 [Salix dunnii]|uniref:Uncharacterized protein n=1 Tax=Salix dunnii TaxID=1413687 RepID=A0A835JXY1_9ROSI|nr:hypothetical protein SADUNF_Sadunf06G0024400 [Salix dunnii]
MPTSMIKSPNNIPGEEVNHLDGGILSSITAKETSPATTSVFLSAINSIQDDVPSTDQAMNEPQMMTVLAFDAGEVIRGVAITITQASESLVATACGGHSWVVMVDQVKDKKGANMATKGSDLKSTSINGVKMYMVSSRQHSPASWVGSRKKRPSLKDKRFVASMVLVVCATKICRLYEVRDLRHAEAFWNCVSLADEDSLPLGEKAEALGDNQQTSA